MRICADVIEPIAMVLPTSAGADISTWPQW